MAQGYLSTSLGWARACRHTWATGSLAAETEKLQRFPLKWPLLLRTQHGNLISSHFISTPHHFETFFRVTFGAEAWSHINIRGITEQRDTQDLAAEEQIQTKAMDVPRPFLLLLCALYLTCKYCLLYCFEPLQWCVEKQLCTQWTDTSLIEYTCLTLMICMMGVLLRTVCETSVLYSKVGSIYHPFH